MMNKTFNTLTFLFFIFLSWTDTLSIQNKVPLFMIFGALLIISSIVFYGKLNVSIYGAEDFVWLVLLVWVILTSLIHLNGKSLNYLLTYIYVFIFLYLGLKGVFHTNISLNTILRANFFGVYFTLAFVIFEFVANTFLGMDVQSFLPRRRETSAIFMDYFNRSYGFSSEPGVLAYYFSTMGLISLWHLFYNCGYSRIIKKILAGVFVLGYLTLYSAAGILSLTFGVIVSCLLNLRLINLNRRMVRTVSAVFVLAISFPFLVNVFSPMYLKVANLSANHSGRLRMERWIEAKETISQSPIFGVGIGAISAEGHGSPLSWYLFLMSEAGVFAGVLIFLFYLLFFLRIQRSNVDGKILLLASFLAGVVHLSVISTFQYPFLFVGMILISLILKKQH